MLGDDVWRELCGRPLGDDLPAVHDLEAVSELADEVLFHDDDRPAPKSERDAIDVPGRGGTIDPFKCRTGQNRELLEQGIDKRRSPSPRQDDQQTN